MNQEELEEAFEIEKNNLKVRYLIITVFVAIVVALLSSEISLMYYSNKFGDLNKIEKAEIAASNSNEKNIEVIADTLKSFREVIDREFIGEIDETKVLDETIKGYVNGLDDEYSEYLTAEDWEEFETLALGNYVGVGIYMSTDKYDNVVVVEPIKDSPAEKAGIQSGDIIKKVIIEDGVTSIGSNAFFAKFQNITLPVSVVAVRDDAVFWYAMSDEGFYGFYEGTQEQFDAISFLHQATQSNINYSHELSGYHPYPWLNNQESTIFLIGTLLEHQHLKATVLRDRQLFFHQKLPHSPQYYRNNE